MVNGDQAKGFLQFFLGMMDSEFNTTRKVIAAVPQAKCEWRPDPKARNGLDLAWHIPTAEIFFMDGIIKGSFDMSGEEPPPPKTISEVVSFYDKNYNDRLAKLKGLSGEQLAKSLPFFGAIELPAVMFLN